MADFLARPLTKKEMDAMRRAARDEASVSRKFWSSLKRVVNNLPFAEDLVAAFVCAKDPQTSPKVRYALLGGLGYFIMPIDALPDILPLIGYSDDMAVLAALVGTVAGAIKPEHRDKARKILDKSRKG
ncbi:YkvA family protein [Pseudochelatococcus contaminans]|uniref:Uncharacterized membrane protein YkvA (DUF1232 family) n=1 Tax=Pseudochelatococcus contaminans TaxID=1538103 RepID=A0A7W5Z3G3_9HYPH|nr:YkvA family protein [Pseudochelatococcus contaminans]MBB3809042.1 uncharacterized membrane protein YkvA (DUF1232 family) [Pseudochelatococcus contaminans]